MVCCKTYLEGCNCIWIYLLVVCELVFSYIWSHHFPNLFFKISSYITFDCSFFGSLKIPLWSLSLSLLVKHIVLGFVHTFSHIYSYSEFNPAAAALFLI